jgi:hypothetical protein
MKKTIEQKNIDFFSKNQNYQKNILNLDTYKILYDGVTKHLAGYKKLLDIGHGGAFDYDTSKIEKIIGLDLDQMIDLKNLPPNIKLEYGSALKIPDHLKNFDILLLAMLIHHLVGKNVKENLKNLNICIEQSRKALVLDGKLLIVESCVPRWFYFIEKILFRPTSYFINKFFKHPPAFQFTKDIIINTLKNNHFKEIKVQKIKQGKFILQYGVKFPTFLTPVMTYIFTAKK